jgi:hypothetical protein
MKVARFLWVGFVTFGLVSGYVGRAEPSAKPTTVPATTKTIAVDFEDGTTDKMPEGFTSAVTNGPEGKWVVQEVALAPSGKLVLAQTNTESTDGRFALCVYDKLSAKDVSVTVRFKCVAGKVDQAAGLVVRYQDRDNYYVARANALEDNIRLYKVEKGKRHQFASASVRVPSGEWQDLTLAVLGTKLTVSHNGKVLYEHEDTTFKDAGKVGLWTKADSVTQFDDLTIKVFDAP